MGANLVFRANVVRLSKEERSHGTSPGLLDATLKRRAGGVALFLLVAHKSPVTQQEILHLLTICRQQPAAMTTRALNSRLLFAVWAPQLWERPARGTPACCIIFLKHF